MGDPAVNAPQAMTHAQKMRLRAAAAHAGVVLPGPIGSLLAREFLASEEFGYLARSDSLTWRAAEDVMRLSTDDVAPVLAPDRADTTRPPGRPVVHPKIVSGGP